MRRRLRKERAFTLPVGLDILLADDDQDRQAYLLQHGQRIQRPQLTRKGLVDGRRHAQNQHAHRLGQRFVCRYRAIGSEVCHGLVVDGEQRLAARQGRQLGGNLRTGYFADRPRRRCGQDKTGSGHRRGLRLVIQRVNTPFAVAQDEDPGRIHVGTRRQQAHTALQLLAMTFHADFAGQVL